MDKTNAVKQLGIAQAAIKATRTERPDPLYVVLELDPYGAITIIGDEQGQPFTEHQEAREVMSDLDYQAQGALGMDHEYCHMVARVTPFNWAIEPGTTVVQPAVVR